MITVTVLMTPWMKYDESNGICDIPRILRNKTILLNGETNYRVQTIKLN